MLGGYTYLPQPTSLTSMRFGVEIDRDGVVHSPVLLSDPAKLMCASRGLRAVTVRQIRPNSKQKPWALDLSGRALVSGLSLVRQRLS